MTCPTLYIHTFWPVDQSILVCDPWSEAKSDVISSSQVLALVQTWVGIWVGISQEKSKDWRKLREFTEICAMDLFSWVFLYLLVCYEPLSWSLLSSTITSTLVALAANSLHYKNNRSIKRYNTMTSWCWCRLISLFRAVLRALIKQEVKTPEDHVTVAERQTAAAIFGNKQSQCKHNSGHLKRQTDKSPV